MDALISAKSMIQTYGRHKDGVPVIIIFVTDGGSGQPNIASVVQQMHSEMPQVSQAVRVCKLRPIHQKAMDSIFKETIIALHVLYRHQPVCSFHMQLVYQNEQG